MDLEVDAVVEVGKLTSHAGGVAVYASAGRWDVSSIGMIAMAGGYTQLLAARTKVFGQKVQRLARLKTPILDAAQIFLGLYEQLLGYGSPEAGARLSSAAKDFNLAYDQLHDATPDSKWTGYAASCYDQRNQEQLTRVQQLQDADDALSAILSSEATAVINIRVVIAIAKDALFAAVLPAILLQGIPLIGPKLSFLYQVEAVLEALPACVEKMHELDAKSADNAKAIRKITATYRAIESSAMCAVSPLGPWRPPVVDEAPQNSIGVEPLGYPREDTHDGLNSQPLPSPVGAATGRDRPGSRHARPEETEKATAIAAPSLQSIWPRKPLIGPAATRVSNQRSKDVSAREEKHNERLGAAANVSTSERPPVAARSAMQKQVDRMQVANTAVDQTKSLTNTSI